VSFGRNSYQGSVKGFQGAEMTSDIRTFEDLECWKACRVLRLFIAKTVVPALPSEERFGLKPQILYALLKEGRLIPATKQPITDNR